VGIADLLERPPDARVPITAVWALWLAAVEATGDRALALRYGLATRLEYQGLFGFAVMTSPTIGEAGRRAGRFLHLITDSARLVLVERSDHAVFRWEREGAGEPGHDVANETVVGQIVAGITQLAGRSAVKRVTFRHAAPAAAATLEKLLPCPVTWRSRNNDIVVPAAELALPSRDASPEMAAYFDARIAERPAESTALADRVAAAIREALDGGEPDAERIARALGLSERTLRRHLATEGTSFRAVLDAVRGTRARALLADERLTLTEVAFALGFSEHSAFTRAFTRWFGEPPAAHRARHASR
jgi:AraC-like DNA-binding protein